MSVELDWILGFVGEKGFDPEKHRKRIAAYRAKRRRSGLCITCGKPNEGNLQECTSCQDKGNSAITRRRYERSAAGLCYECGTNPSVDKGKRCIGCAEKVAEVSRNVRRLRRERLESEGATPTPPRAKAPLPKRKVRKKVSETSNSFMEAHSRQRTEDENAVQAFYEEQARLRSQERGEG